MRGEVDWDSDFTVDVTAAATHLTGNGLPVTPTGTFPVSSSDPAYQYDRNPNTIKPYELDVELPSSPKPAATPTCVGGTIGVSVLGAPIYSAFDATTEDLDECHGRTSEISWQGKKVTMYHYVATADFPYLVGCYRGTPITSATGLSIGRPR